MARRGWLGLWEPNASAVCHGLNNTEPSPVSIVIPHMGGRRHNNLGHLIAFLLSQRFMRHPSSEIVINHGCNLSWSERGMLDGLSRRLLTTGPGRGAQKPFAQMKQTAASAAAAARIRGAVTHMFGPRTELFAASRYFAAAEARNEVLVSMDDDVMPYPSQAALVEALQCSVRREVLRGSQPALHGSQVRFCGERGYEGRRPPDSSGDRRSQHDLSAPHPDLVVLTNFAAMSRSRLRAVTARFDELYTPAMLATRGNGEDLSLAKAVGRFVVVSGHVRTARYRKGYSTAAGHMAQRALLCCCLAEGLAGAALAACVRQGAGGTSRASAAAAARAAHLSARACLCSRFAHAENTTVRDRWRLARQRCAAPAAREAPSVGREPQL